MAKKFHLSIYTPKFTFFDREAVELNIEIANGYIGVLAGHVPIISSVKTCKFIIKEDKKGILHGVIESGILYFENNILKVFATNVVWSNEIDKEKTHNEIEKIKEKLNADITDFQKKRLIKSLNYNNLQL